MFTSITSPSLASEIAAGNVLKLRNLADRFDVDPSVAFRWMQRGLPDGKGGRVRLEAIKRGKCWVTSEAAIKRFFAGLPQSAPTSAAPPIRTPTKREGDSARAEATLRDKYGI